MTYETSARFLRGTLRLFVLVALLLVIRTEAISICRRSLRERCRWRQLWCQRLLRALRIPLHIIGSVPSSGLLVSNHLTYLDILTFGAVFSGVLVSKREVRSWPLLGAITAAAGTIYVDRASVRSAAEAGRAMQNALAGGLPVLLFPEGTTSAGETVLPFQAPLFEAAVRSRAAIFAAAVRYNTDGSSATDLARVPYWGDMTLAPHLIRVLRLPGLCATIRVAGEPVYAEERRAAAASMHSAVEELHARNAPVEQPVGATAPWLRAISSR